MKQTAVEWLFERYVETAGLLSVQDVEKAIAMEREQIEEAYHYGDHDCIIDAERTASEYYTETYGK